MFYTMLRYSIVCCNDVVVVVENNDVVVVVENNDVVVVENNDVVVVVENNDVVIVSIVEDNDVGKPTIFIPLRNSFELIITLWQWRYAE